MIPRAVAGALCLLPFVLSVTPLETAQAAIAPSAATATSAQPARAAAAPLRTADPFYNNFGLNREVFGYASAGSLGSSTIGYPSWNFNLLATVAFFALHMNYNGTLNTSDGNWSVWNSSTLTGLVNTAHAHGTKVVATVVGPGSADLCNALYHDQVTVSALVAQVQAKGIDGVNIDIESQLAQCTPTDPAFTPMTNQALLTQFARDLRAGLDAAKPGYYLSIATYSGSALGNDGFFNIPDLNLYVDSFFVMAYDMDFSNQHHPPLNCSSFCMAPISPLTNYFWNDTDSMAQYASVVGAGKVILGQPYYARVSCVATVSAHATATTAVQAAAYTVASNVVNSPDVKAGSFRSHLDPTDVAGKDRWDAWYDNAYKCWRVMHWSDATTLSVRYDLVNQQNLRGVGFWTLNYGGGSPELWNALQSRFVKCTSATVGASPASTAPAGSLIGLTAGSTGCLNPRYEFWVQYPNGTWYLKRGWGGATFNWDTTGLAPGVYTVHAWANRSGASWEAIGSVTLTLTGCTSGAVSPPTPSQAAGSTVALTASSAGCPNPRYEFWVQYPSGAWYLKQGWGGAAFNWNTSGLSPGAYTVHAWVNNQGSGYDTIGEATVTLTGCTAGSISPPNPSQAAGSMVALTASSTGCPNPRYSFWVQYPSGAWYLKQGWGGASFNWNTSGLTPGTYTVHVWVNNQGNGYDTIGSATVTLTGCTSGSINPSNPSQKAGTMVALTAGSAGCSNPRYAFWVQYPNGAWYLKQSWGGPAFNWNTSGLIPGTYTVHVWVNTQGNGYDTIGSATVTLTA